MVCTHRELYRTKNILRIREPRIIGPYTESCGFMTHITMAQHDTNALMDYRYRPCIHTWPALYLGHKIRTLYRHLSKHLSLYITGGVPALVNKRWHSHAVVGSITAVKIFAVANVHVMGICYLSETTNICIGLYLSMLSVSPLFVSAYDVCCLSCLISKLSAF